MRRHLRSVIPFAVSLLAACTEPAPQPISGSFAFEGQFEGRELKRFVGSSSGVVIAYDSTALNEPVAGAIRFDSVLVESITSSRATLFVNTCQHCSAGTGAIGNALRSGDSVKVFFGSNLGFQLLGVYRGDSISGRIQQTDPFTSTSGDGVSTYWGTFVARRVEADPTTNFVLRGLFDSLKATDGHGDTTTRTGAADSIRGPLVIEALNIGPLANLTVEKCGASCFGGTAAFPAAFGGFTGAGRRNGDSVVFTILWDLTSQFTVNGAYKGDSIAGTMSSVRSTSSSTIYSGHFVARRVP